MEQKIVLKDGIEIQGASVTIEPWSGNLLCVVPGTDVVGTTILLGDPQKTSEIVFYHDVKKDIYTGYIHVKLITVDDNNKVINVWLYGDGDEKQETDYTVPIDYIPWVKN